MNESILEVLTARFLELENALALSEQTSLDMSVYMFLLFRLSTKLFIKFLKYKMKIINHNNQNLLKTLNKCFYFS